MARAPRMTMATQLVLRALLADPTGELYGSEIGEAAGLMSGTVHPILARLEAAGWVQSRWEDVDPQVAGRPARRYYTVTGEGVQQARAALARVPRPHPGRLAPRPEPGLP
ncbi:PadR family transcriptional regulator [Oryzobacter sp. R7]|uniref:PadR family transcriptional regulator n=1 Tax=Oryzobacter faecalis TaxID=3388656 RepID=UPI00398D651E